MKQETSPVLIVGGSLVGLSAAMFLGHHGVHAIVVEKHPGSSPHPRAIGFTTRTMETFSACGLRVPEVPPTFRGLRRVRADSLAGTWHEEQKWNPAAKPAPTTAAPKLSPHTGAAIAQDALEPMIRARAVELGADVRVSTELLSFTQNESGVTAVVKSKDGEPYEIYAQYMIAADGLRGPIREQLGITRTGRGHMETLRSVLFKAPLQEYLERGVFQFNIDQPDFKAFLTTYNDGRWCLMFSDDVERDEATILASVKRAIGRADLPIEILAHGRWELTALVADRFAEGRIFLAGDAAHTLPPTRGGYGANTGIDDAHNLAWKIKAVLAGTSTPALLDTYSEERRPIAWLRHQQTFARPDYAPRSNGIAEGVAILDDDAIELGQLYRSAAILGAGPDLPPARRPDEWMGQPGTRAPFAPLPDGRSTLDVLQRGWILFTQNDAWSAPGVEVVRIGDEARKALGLGLDGCSLVRPDGYIAWRSADSGPNSALTAALHAVSCRFFPESRT